MSQICLPVAFQIAFAIAAATPSNADLANDVPCARRVRVRFLSPSDIDLRHVKMNGHLILQETRARHVCASNSVSSGRALSVIMPPRNLLVFRLTIRPRSNTQADALLWLHRRWRCPSLRRIERHRNTSRARRMDLWVSCAERSCASWRAGSPRLARPFKLLRCYHAVFRLGLPASASLLMPSFARLFFNTEARSTTFSFGRGAGFGGFLPLRLASIIAISASS